MYKRIEAQMILAGISKKELAQKSNIRYNTLLQKLRGHSSFTLDEALLIKKIIGASDSVEDLFQKSA